MQEEERGVEVKRLYSASYGTKPTFFICVNLRAILVWTAHLTDCSLVRLLFCPTAYSGLHVVRVKVRG